MTANKWYEFYKKRVEEVRQRNPEGIIMCKEKYGRFDISACQLENKFDYDYLFFLEEDSIGRCMNCAKYRKQFDTEFNGWYRHYCLPCYVKEHIIHFRWKIKYLFFKMKQCLN